MIADNFCFSLQNKVIQTSQTGGQQYSDTSPFSIPWLIFQVELVLFLEIWRKFNAATEQCDQKMEIFGHFLKKK